jgi:hypothetical protein
VRPGRVNPEMKKGAHCEGRPFMIPTETLIQSWRRASATSAAALRFLNLFGI